MTRLSPELKVGFLAIGVLLVLSFMTLRVGGLQLTKPRGYMLYAYFDNTVGLDTKTRVKVAGVNAGTIETIELDGHRARLTLRMDPAIRIRSDAVASIRAMGLLGDKYLSLSSGSEAVPFLEDGDTITQTRAPTDYDALVSNLSTMSAKFARVADSLNQIVSDEENQTGIAESIRKISQMADSLNRAVTSNEEKLTRLLTGVSELVESLNTVLSENRETLARTTRGMDRLFNDRAPVLMDEMETAARDLRELIGQLREPVLASAQNVEEASRSAEEALARIGRIAEKIEKGEGTLGKLATDEALYDAVNQAAGQIGKQLERIDRFRVFVEFKGEQLTGVGDTKGAFYLRFQPHKEKYYLLGLVTDPRGSTKTREIVVVDALGNTQRTTETTTERKLEFTALIAKRFRDAVVRGGLIENTFGLGLDYLLFNDRLTLTSEIWDFGKDEYEADHPHLKLGLDYRPFKHVFFTAGYDNILNARTEGVFFGGGIRFEDEDLKYLFGAVPAVPVN